MPLHCADRVLPRQRLRHLVSLGGWNRVYHRAKDGVPIIGATGAQTAAENGTVNIGMSAIVRNACGCESSILSLVLGGVAAVVNNMAVTVEKL